MKGWGGGVSEKGCGGGKKLRRGVGGESKGEVCSVETAMWDFSGQILEAGVWTKIHIFQLGMCIVPGRLPTTEKGGWGVEREKERREYRGRKEEEEKAREVKKEKIK